MPLRRHCIHAPQCSQSHPLRPRDIPVTPPAIPGQRRLGGRWLFAHQLTLCGFHRNRPQSGKNQCRYCALPPPMVLRADNTTVQVCALFSFNPVLQSVLSTVTCFAQPHHIKRFMIIPVMAIRPALTATHGTLAWPGNFTGPHCCLECLST